MLGSGQSKICKKCSQKIAKLETLTQVVCFISALTLEKQIEVMKDVKMLKFGKNWDEPLAKICF